MSSGIGSCDNLELPSPTFNHKTKPQIPLKFDHNQIWTQLRHLIKTQIKGDLDENPTGQALADLIHKEQKFWQKRSNGYRIRLGKHADVQGKGKNIGIKHRTLYLKDLLAKSRSHGNDTTTTQRHD